jgi:hypothetical protein
MSFAERAAGDAILQGIVGTLPVDRLSRHRWTRPTCIISVRPSNHKTIAPQWAIARQFGWEAVLPHVAMFPIELLLPHLFCSLARGAKEAGRITGRDCERAPCRARSATERLQSPRDRCSGVVKAASRRRRWRIAPAA